MVDGLVQGNQTSDVGTMYKNTDGTTNTMVLYVTTSHIRNLDQNNFETVNKMTWHALKARVTFVDFKFILRSACMTLLISILFILNCSCPV